MIVIKVEIWPKGDASKAYEHSRAFITNDFITTQQTKGEYGSYKAEFMQSYKYNPKKVWKRGRVKNIHRKRRGVWDIIYVALRSAGLARRNPIR